MKTLIGVCAILILVVGCSMKGQPSPLALSPLDKEILKRTESQLQTLQLRYQSEAAPIIKEHDDLVASYCTKAGLIASGQNANCQVDVNAGTITKRDRAVATPTK